MSPLGALYSCLSGEQHLIVFTELVASEIYVDVSYIVFGNQVDLSRCGVCRCNF